MPLELHSLTGAIRERHPSVEAILDRLSRTFTESIVTSDSYVSDSGGTVYRIWLDGDLLYGWAYPLSDIRE